MIKDESALIRSVALAENGKYMLLLGAGASASSGIPTAEQCVWEWKRGIYLTRNNSVSTSFFNDVRLPLVQKKIQQWLDQQGKFPPLGDPREYNYYAQETYPLPVDRRAYFQSRFSTAIPQVGYRALSLLLSAMKIKTVWSPNFDGLVVKARSPDQTMPFKEIGIDSVSRINHIDEGFPTIISLHGDYRYDFLSNTSEETRKLNYDLQQKLVEMARKQPLIIIGYGGRDESIMKALLEAYSEKGEGGSLYWCIRKGNQLPERVQNLLAIANKNGYPSSCIEIENFDVFMLNMARYVFQGRPESNIIEKMFFSSLPEGHSFGLDNYVLSQEKIIANALPLEIPRQLYQIELREPLKWEELLNLIHSRPVIAGIHRGKILALGDLENIIEIFSPKSKSKIELIPLEQNDLRYSNTIVRSIFTQALQRSIAELLNCKYSGKNIIWDQNEESVEEYKGEVYKLFSAMEVKLSKIDHSFYLHILPTIKITKGDGDKADKLAVQELKRRKLSGQYNKLYQEAIDRWKVKIFGQRSSLLLRYPRQSSEDTAFKIFKDTVSAILCYPPVARAQQLTQNVIPHSFKAIRISEPNLIFGSARNLRFPKDTHPIRGIVEHGPFELQLGFPQSIAEIRLAVLCSEGYENKFSEFLQKFRVSLKYPDEYLPEFPGFQQAYRLPLKIPLPQEGLWRKIHETFPGNDNIKNLQNAANTIIREIENIESKSSVDVILIFVPSAWEKFEHIETEESSLNLHDLIKAHCAQRGLRTQFIREKSLFDQNQCRVFWWLSQAIYVKSLRTPFILESTDSDTVYVGIGYGLFKDKSERGVIVGCSHIYDSSGNGLRYRLSKIHSPRWIQKNPYLSKEDAYMVGIQIRQIFYETYQKMPSRVVIHKRTPFLRSEREGLLEALNGVYNIELITIEREDSWRFTAFNSYYKNAELYPVKRGTITLLNSNEFLIWVHGTTTQLDQQQKRNYYQGRRRIPTPLKITRFCGKSDLSQIGREILALSKMDWNNFELYNQMPVTLETSAAIARIGKLISRFNTEIYDYRLFM